MSFDLVTGCSGFIGRHLVRALRASGRRVVGMDISGPPGGLGLDGYVAGSVLEERAVRGAMAGAERVFHVAGNARLEPLARAGALEINAEGAGVVAGAALRAGVRRMVHVSTDALTAGRALGPYTASKLRGERAVREAMGQGLDGVIVRPGAPLGPEDENMTPPTRMLRLFMTAPPPLIYDAELWLVDVRDLATALVTAGDRGLTGAAYSVSAGAIRLSGLLGMLGMLGLLPGRSGGRAAVDKAGHVPRARMPYAGALLAGVVGELLALIAGIDPPATLEGVRAGRPGRRRLASRPAAELGVAFRGLPETVNDTAAWLHESGRLG